MKNDRMNPPPNQMVVNLGLQIVSKAQIQGKEKEEFNINCFTVIYWLKKISKLINIGAQSV